MSIIRSNNKKTKLYIKTTTSKFLNKTLALVKESKYEIETSGPSPRAPGAERGPSAARLGGRWRHFKNFALLQFYKSERIFALTVTFMHSECGCDGGST